MLAQTSLPFLPLAHLALCPSKWNKVPKAVLSYSVPLSVDESSVSDQQNTARGIQVTT
jgi:hypothetical protein